MLGGCPLLLLLLLAPGDPLLPLGRAMHWERMLPYRGVTPFFWSQSARRRRALSVPCFLICLARGVPSLLVGHAMRWERMLPYRGFPPFPWIWPRAAARSLSPLFLLPARSLRARLGRGDPVLDLGLVCRGGPSVVCSGAPPPPVAAARL